MRTTIELSDDHRAALLALAARRGAKGFSAIVSEAIRSYLVNVAADDAKRERAALMRGCLTHEEAEDLEQGTAKLRGEWR